MQYIFKLLMAVITRLRTILTNPVRNFVRRLQMMVNTNVIANKLIKPLTKKVKELFHIKPKSEQEYYSLGKFLIAKKLISAFIVACCVAVFCYFTLIADPVEKTVTTTTGIITDVNFDYDDMKLAEFSGKANIKGAGKTVVYTGDIKDGVCDGSGILYNQSGVLVYEGDFAGNKFNGQGKHYYQDGTVQYEGEFVENVYEGEGIFYHPSGKTAYKGSFKGGFYSGNGFLYGETGELIYEGTFQNGLYHGMGVLYYEDGNKKYEGEFVMGSPQGEGILYTAAGRPYYKGIVKDGEVAYESLVSLSLGEVEEMFYDEPSIYYTSDKTCFVFDTAEIALDLDCIVRIVTKDIEEEGAEAGTPSEGVGWYLPEGAQDAVVLDTSGQDEDKSKETDKSEDKDKSENEDESKEADKSEDVSVTGDADKPTDYVTEEQKVYYYVNNAEWVAEAELDKTAVKISGVTVYRDDIKNPFSSEQEYIAANGLIELSDCIAIEKIRKNVPTAFSNITFEEAGQNYRYTYVKNINYAQAVYEEIIDKAEFKYQMCYQIDNAETLYYYKVSGM